MLKNPPIVITKEQEEKLNMYAGLVFDKKDQLNLTSILNKQELFDRHIEDGLWGVKCINSLTQNQNISIVDLGAGAGYIGIVCGIVLPNSRVTLLEGMEKRCKFLNWAILKLGLNNVVVVQQRAGERKMTEEHKFDFVLERAMGKIEDILPICLSYKKEKGHFLAYQSEVTVTGNTLLSYKLKDGKTRNLVVF